MARTKIVATVGPSTREPEMLKRLIRLGVDVFRLNFSHGNKKDHSEMIKKIRNASGEKPIAILGDLSGPKIRCGDFKEGAVKLKRGQPFILTTENIPGDEGRVSVNYTPLPSEVKPGEIIFLDDGNIELKITGIDGRNIVTEIINDGILSSRKGINLPQTSISAAAPTVRDQEMIEFSVTEGLDMFALSFVKSPEDVRETRNAIRKAGGDAPVIAKIEKHEAIENLEGIINEADGAMVARGDLGVEIPLQKVPVIQKRIIDLCNQCGKPVITATQMLESMIKKPRPTRAEVTDIANAIMDGTDAVMLSGETAVGKFPDKAVEFMNTVAEEIETSQNYEIKLENRRLAETGSVPDAISLATCEIAQSLDVSAILCCSATGYTARFVARYRPSCPIVVLTLRPEVQRRLNLTWGVHPFVMEEFQNDGGEVGFDAVIKRALEIARENGFTEKGRKVVVTAGLPLGIGGTTNMLRVLEV